MASRTPRTPSTSSGGWTTVRPTSASSARRATSASPRSRRSTIEARADDDHGLDRLELVVGVRGAARRPCRLAAAGLSVTGRHTVYLEDLDVKPGDFVSFYARARDVGRGKRPTESRSDIFFLEVTPFVDEFAMAQSQAMAGASGQQVDDLVAPAEGHHRRHVEAAAARGRRQCRAVGRRREDAGPGAGGAAPACRNRRAPGADAGGGRPARAARRRHRRLGGRAAGAAGRRRGRWRAPSRSLEP